jgi:hypothetical protein
VLKLIPVGVSLIAKLVMASPVEIMVKPVATVLTVLVSDEEERVKAGGPCGTAEAGEVPTVNDCKIGASNVRITATINLRNLVCKFLTLPFGPNLLNEDWSTW